MKIKDFDDARHLVTEYRRIKNEIAIVGASNALGVTIQGKYQDEPMLVEVRPVVLAYLESELNKIKHALIPLGVFDFEEE